MSERFQKTFISVREFIESWDKEIYELNHLDFFIFLLINHLGNQLDRQFFNTYRHHSPLYLDFEDLGNLCFNLGDNLEYFLQDNCFGSCSLNCPLNLDAVADPDKFEGNEWMERKLDVLRSLIDGPLVHERCLRVDLMNQVILETLLQFYADEMHMEFEEDDLEIVEMAEFIEGVIIDFIRTDGQHLLQNPFELAMDYFEELLATDDDYEDQEDWHSEEGSWMHSDGDENWEQTYEDIHLTFDRFLQEYQANTSESSQWLANDIDLFRQYLVERSDVFDIYDLHEEHFLEFLSYWLVRYASGEDNFNVQHIFRSMARLINWIYNTYGLDYRQSFLEYYEKVKREVPRVMRALKIYLEEYDILDVLLHRNNEEVEQVSGYFEIRFLDGHRAKRMDLVDVQLFAQFPSVHLNSSAYSELRQGDILHATLVKRNNGWEVLEIHYIYPPIAKAFIH